MVDPEFREYRVKAAVEDRWNHLWVGSFGYGVADIYLPSGFVTLMPFGLYQDNINAIYFDDDDIWFGGEPFGASQNAITMWDRRDGTWRYFEGRYNDWISSDNVSDITGDDNFIFFATDYGLVKYYKHEEKFRSFTRPLGLRSTELYSLYLEDSLLFMGGSGTIDVLLIPKDSIFALRTPDLMFGKVYAMSHIGDNFWVGTDYGVYRFDKRSFKWSRFNIPSGYLGGAVWQFLEGTSGDIWFAGSDGIVHLDSDLIEIESFLTRHDLKESMPHRIALADNLLWVGTDKGILRYNRLTKNWLSYDMSDGLIDNYVNDLKLEKDYIWFATQRGVTRFYWNNPLRIRNK